MKFIILPILGVFAFRTSGVSADCCQTTITTPCIIFKGYTFHSDCKAGTDAIVCGKINPGTDGEWFTVCGTNGITTSCGNIYSSMKTCVAAEPTSTPPTPNLLDDTPSSAGKIGMGYVWFVAAAVAFAGIN